MNHLPASHPGTSTDHPLDAQCRRLQRDDPRSFLAMPPAPAPSVEWAFTLRTGGVSQSPWDGGGDKGDGLNLGLYCGDEASAVRCNRQRLAAAIGRPIVWLRQIHGTTVVDQDLCGENPAGEEAEADAQLTTRRDVALGIQVADCLPVLLADQQGRVVGAAHAGWRSLAGGILQATVQAMRQKVPQAVLTAWLGPCIGPGAFEVGDEVRAAFLAALPQAEVQVAHAFTAGAQPGKWLANLSQLARLHLEALGVTRIVGDAHCTWSDPQRFWSYRRDQRCGRMAALIWLSR
ncbi:MAG: peptidoglycan editing factor PgeF [Lautropia sp.]|nr:peptidoglycan editing factor PgeF [Lautropia sp.]